MRLNGCNVAPDGWVSTVEDGLGVHLRVEGSAEPVITGIFIQGAKIDTDSLRSIHPGRILAAVAVYLGCSTDDSALTIGELTRRATEIMRVPERLPLGRPNGGRDEFYRRVARGWQSASAESGRPAVALAEENGVPVETVRGWVKEARRRGFLPPGRPRRKALEWETA